MAVAPTTPPPTIDSRLSHAAVDAASDPICCIEQNGRISYVNNALCRDLGYSRDECVSLTFHAIAPEFPPAIWTAHWPRLEQEGHVIVESRYRKSDGMEFAVELSLLHVTADRHACCWAVARDITRRKRVDDTLRESERKFRQITTNIREVFWMAVVGKGLYYVSPAYEEIWGRPVEAAYGSPDQWLATVHPDDRDRVESVLQQWWDGKEASVEYRILRPDGTERWIWDRGFPVENSSDGRRLITGIAEDVTERKHQEQRLLLTQFSLDRAAHSVYWVDPEARIVYVNDTAVSWLGYSRDELERMTLYDFVVDFDESQFESELHMFEQRRHLVLESAHRRKDGTTFPVEVTVNYVRFGDVDRLCCFAQDITERKRAEETIRESEWKFRRLATNIHEIFWMAEPGQRILYVSPAYEEIFGRACETLYDNPNSWLAAVHPDDRPRATEATKRQLKGEHTALEYRVVRPDGTERWVWDRGFPVADSGLTHPVYTGIAEDITERKHRQRELELTQFAVDHAGEGICWIAKDARIIYANETASDTMGYSRAELLTLTVHDIAPAFPVGVWREFWERLTNEGPVVFETEARCRDGTLIPLEISASYVVVEGQEFCCASSRDIERRKLDEAALRASEDRFRSVVETAGSIIIWLSPDFTILEWNKEAEGIFGVTRAEAVGKNYIDHFMPDVDRDVLRREKEAVLSGHETHEFENHVTHTDGTTRTVSWKVTPLFDAADNPDGLIATGHDVTGREEAEREQRARDAKAQHMEKLESLGVLAGGIAHDFNNLLMAMLGHAELALMELPSTSPTANDLKEISTAARRAAELTKQMLAFAGKGNFVTEPVDASGLVSGMADLLDASVPGNVVLSLDLAEGLPAIEADTGQIQQLLRNLVINAVEAIGDETGTVSVRTRRDRVPGRAYVGGVFVEGDVVSLEVRDTGCGMDEDTQQKMFDPFFTTKFAGRGLGLAAVLGIVRAHSAAMSVESEPERGTVISVLFPVSRRRVDVPAASDIGSGAWPGGGTVLVVDDEAAVRSLTGRILEKHGLTVFRADDGHEAVQIFRKHMDDIDIVLLDLTMPRLGGEATVKELRAVRSNVRVILASGFSEEDVASRFVGLGLAGFLQKPYTPDDLMEKIREVLSRNPALSSGYGDASATLIDSS